MIKRVLIPSALGAATAIALLAPLAASPAQPLQFHLGEQSNSNERGTATLLQGHSGLIVKLRLSGAPENVDQPVHIHKGTCAKLDPKPAYALTSLHNGQSESHVGTVTLSDLQKGDYAINVHKGPGKDAAIYVACGNIPKSK